ncbi:MAG: glycosyltransferase [Dehalococcoidales bacterium]|jgi:predicted glycosyltransferase
MDKILFFSNKRGFGHIKRDELIEKNLKEMDKSLDIRRAGAISGKDTALVISDEEFSAIADASEKKIPSVLITNWFPDKRWLYSKGRPYYKYFNKAGLIIFTDIKNLVEVPSFVKPPVFFSGPIIDKSCAMHNVRRDRCTRILVTSGKTEPVDREFFETAVAAFRKIRTKAKMVILAGGFKCKLSKYASRDMKIEKYLPDVESLYRASDLVITRGGHTTLWELAFCGVPSISVPRPFYSNPCNLGYALNMEKLGTTKVVPQDFLTASSLAYYMDNILKGKAGIKKASQAIFKEEAGKRAASAILRYLGNCR